MSISMTNYRNFLTIQKNLTFLYLQFQQDNFLLQFCKPKVLLSHPVLFIQNSEWSNYNLYHCILLKQKRFRFWGKFTWVCEMFVLTFMATSLVEIMMLSSKRIIEESLCFRMEVSMISKKFNGLHICFSPSQIQSFSVRIISHPSTEQCWPSEKNVDFH